MQPELTDFTDDEKATFSLYKSNSQYANEQYFADFVNHSLRNDVELTPEWIDAANILDSIIAKGTIDTGTNLYRATPDKFVSPYISGETLIYPAYMSTAREEHAVQRHFSGNFRDIPAALLRINCACELPGLDLEIDASYGGNELEYLLPRNSIFKIIDTNEITDRFEMNKIMSEFYAENYTKLIIYKLDYVGST